MATANKVFAFLNLAVLAETLCASFKKVPAAAKKTEAAATRAAADKSNAAACPAADKSPSPRRASAASDDAPAAAQDGEPKAPAAARRGVPAARMQHAYAKAIAGAKAAWGSVAARGGARARAAPAKKLTAADAKAPIDGMTPHASILSPASGALAQAGPVSSPAAPSTPVPRQVCAAAAKPASPKERLVTLNLAAGDDCYVKVTLLVAGAPEPKAKNTAPKLRSLFTRAAAPKSPKGTKKSTDAALAPTTGAEAGIASEPKAKNTAPKLRNIFARATAPKSPKAPMSPMSPKITDAAPAPPTTGAEDGIALVVAQLKAPLTPSPQACSPIPTSAHSRQAANVMARLKAARAMVEAASTARDTPARLSPAPLSS